jgi:hypothetical protein
VSTTAGFSYGVPLGYYRGADVIMRSVTRNRVDLVTEKRVAATANNAYTPTRAVPRVLLFFFLYNLKKTDFRLIFSVIISPFHE